MQKRRNCPGDDSNSPTRSSPASRRKRFACTDALVANDEPVGLWTTIADGSANNASRFSFFTTSDEHGQLVLDFSIAGGNYSGIGGIIITQTARGAIPEPTTLALLGLGALGLVRRKRRA